LTNLDFNLARLFFSLLFGLSSEAVDGGLLEARGTLSDSGEAMGAELAFFGLLSPSESESVSSI